MSSVSNNLIANEQVVQSRPKHWIAPIRASLVALGLVAARAGVVTGCCRPAAASSIRCGRSSAGPLGDA